MRVSREQMFMDMAKAAARRSTCFRLNVGAVVVSDRNVVSIGYNGAPSGHPHCTGNGCPYFVDGRGCGVVHAEINALSRIAVGDGRFMLRDASMPKLELYVTHSPCAGCAEAILESGRIGRVYFETAYRIVDPVKALVARGVEVFQLLPSGMMVDHRTGELVS